MPGPAQDHGLMATSPDAAGIRGGLGGAPMSGLDTMDRLFVGWAFAFQIILIVHFAVRRRFFESYTLRFGWLVYALCIPAAVISLVLLLNGKSWFYWLGGFLFVLFAAFGYWVDYVMGIQWRSPFRASVGIPYVLLYLSTLMFYWWPLWNLSRPLWAVYGVLYVVAMVLNIRSH
jgi:hypothetical protein